MKALVVALSALILAVAIVLVSTGALYRYHSYKEFRNGVSDQRWLAAAAKSCQPIESAVPYLRCPVWVQP